MSGHSYKIWKNKQSTKEVPRLLMCRSELENGGGGGGCSSLVNSNHQNTDLGVWTVLLYVNGGIIYSGTLNSMQ